MIPAEVLRRVFFVEFDGTAGTMFAANHKGRQYLVSAKHIFADLSGSGIANIWHDNQWKPLQIHLTGHGSDDVDITVFSTNFLLVQKDLEAQPTHQGLVYGQSVYFLGFPFEKYCDLGGMNQGYPIPFVKQAIVSSFDTPSDKVLYLDGLNNPGFSGGPVVFQPASQLGSPWQIGAVVSGYLAEKSAILDGDTETAMTFAENTGLVHSYPISNAVALMEANPNGVPLE